MFKYENNDMPNSNIKFIITDHVPNSSVGSDHIIVHYKDSPPKVFHGMKIVEAIEEFSDEKNGGINRLISLELEGKVKESLPELFDLYALGEIDCIPQIFFDRVEDNCDKLQRFFDRLNEKKIAEEIAEDVTTKSNDMSLQGLTSDVPFRHVPNQPSFSHAEKDRYSLPNVPSNEERERSL